MNRLVSGKYVAMERSPRIVQVAAARWICALALPCLWGAALAVATGLPSGAPGLLLGCACSTAAVVAASFLRSHSASPSAWVWMLGPVAIACAGVALYAFRSGTDRKSVV